MAGEAFGLKADVKAQLAQLGHTLHPKAQMRAFDAPEPGEHVGVVLLERVVEGVVPDYCTHGYATCVHCHHICWLGDETEKAFRRPGVYPLCLDCAPSVIPPETKLAGRMVDHRRADGPHT